MIKMWFIIVENAFVTAGITSDATKFSHLVQLLEPHHLAKVVDVLDLNDYDRLKKQLLHIYTPKVSDKQRAFYQIETIGDRRPSEFYRDLYQIGVDIGVDFKEVYTRWLELLPVECQNIALLLDVEDEEDINDAINTIDKAYDNVARDKATSSVSAVSQQVSQFRPPPSSVKSAHNTMNKGVNSTTRANKHYRRPTMTQNSARSITASTTPASAHVCWYHYKFGAMARRCRQPCSFQKN